MLLPCTVSHITVPEDECVNPQVLFRHGARTPLTRRYWDGSIWDDCGDAYTHAVAALRRSEGLGAQGSLPGLHVFDKRTKQPQEEFIDGERLVYYQGGCTRGELTKVGQRQVCFGSCSCRPCHTGPERVLFVPSLHNLDKQNSGMDTVVRRSSIQLSSDAILAVLGLQLFQRNTRLLTYKVLFRLHIPGLS